MHSVRAVRYPVDDPAVATLRADGAVWREVDLWPEQCEALAGLRGAPVPAAEPVWVHFPWSGVLVRMVDGPAFHRLRTDRNRDKITDAEQASLGRASIGVVGLSVGNAIATTLVQEGVGGRWVLADFDTLGTSNLNRVRASVGDVGLPKTVVTARQIAEIDPFAEVVCFDEGLTDATLDAFFDGLDVVIDACDGLAMKLRLREAARARRLPVVMETSDRGTLDVERFDRTPDRPLFHGWLPGVDAASVDGLDAGGRLALVARIVGTDVSTRAAASMIQIGETLSTWPQLASDVALGGASATAVVRRILLGQPMGSGRRRVDLTRILEGPPEARTEPGWGVVPTVPPSGRDDHRAWIEAAVQAPSGGNCQPWRFVSVGAALEVHHDRARSESLLDADGFAGLVSVGAAIEGLVLGASARGERLVVEPTGAAEGHVATVHVEGSTPEDPLWPWLGRRFTDRRTPERVPLTDAVREALQAELVDGLRCDLCTDADTLEGLGRHIGAVDRVRFLHPALHREMWAEVRFSDAEALARPDGISVGEMAVSAGDLPVLQLLSRPDVAAFLRRTGGGQGLARLAEDWVASASAVGLLASVSTEPASLLEAGRRMHRVWLTAVQHGYSMQPIGVSAYMIRHIGTPLEEGYRTEDRSVLRACDRALRLAFPASIPMNRLLLFRLLAGGPAYAVKTRRPMTEVWS